MVLKGAKADAAQTQPWPRQGMVDEDGNALATNVVPSPVKDSVCELARVLPSTQKITESADIKRVKAGSVEVEYFTSSAQREVLDLADELNEPYIRPAGRITRA
jgi:hypothetical protein